MPPLFFLFLIITQLVGPANAVSTCTTASGELVDTSQITSQGVLCSECNLRGYMTPSDGCVCVDSDLDPVLGCLRPSEDSYYDEVPITIRKAKVSCECHADVYTGFWKPVYSSRQDTTLLSPDTSPTHIYGHRHPAVCSECYSSLYGPDPRTITASADFTKDKLTPKACTKWGSPDPNRYFNATLLALTSARRRALEVDLGKASDSWSECGGHGIFVNEDSFAYCECSEGWGLKQFPDTPTDYSGAPAPVCIKCAGPWGPPVPWVNQGPVYSPPFCSSPWTPEPRTGELKSCGGHGEYQGPDIGCVCHSNSTHGYWALSEFTQKENVLTHADGQYLSIQQTYHVDTCGACANEAATPKTGCLLAPSSPSPTSSPEAPTY